MRVLEPLGTADRRLGLTLHAPLARDLRINRHSAKVGLDGRGDRSLVGVLGFHLDQADSRRNAARKRTVRRPKALRTPWSAEPFTRAPQEADLELGNGCPPQGASPARAPGVSEAARAGTEPEEDAGAVARPSGRSGQRAVKRAAHARRVSRQADRRGETRVLFDKLGLHVLTRRTSRGYLPAGSSARRTSRSGSTGSHAPCREIAGPRCAAPSPSIDSTQWWCGGG